MSAWGAPQAAAGTVFHNPKVNGSNVDGCLTFGANCGKPAADQFCRLNGFAESSDSSWGYMRPTLVLGDNSRCDNASCGGFTRIVCSGAASPQPGGSCGPGSPRLVMRQADLPQTGQPRGWDNSYLHAPTPAACCQLCRSTNRFGANAAGHTTCKSFLFQDTGGPNGPVCWLQNVDASSPPGEQLRVLTAARPPGFDYYEVGPGGGPIVNPGPGLAGPPISQSSAAGNCANAARPVMTRVDLPQTGQPRGWDNSYLHAPTPAACCQLCATTNRFSSSRAGLTSCKSFLFQDTGGPNGPVCWLQNVDTCSSQPGANLRLETAMRPPGFDYYELTQCRGTTNPIPGGPTNPGPQGNPAGGACADPRTMGIMDEWLSRAIPPQKPGESLRYEAWGRLVGDSLTAHLRVNGPPDTRLSRCDWLWQYAADMRSTNGLGTLRSYVEQRLR
jgi:hypothetical protein